MGSSNAYTGNPTASSRAESLETVYVYNINFPLRIASDSYMELDEFTTALNCRN